MWETQGMNPRKDYPGFWHAVLLCVVVLAFQTGLVIPFLVIDLILKSRLVSHPAVLGVVNIFSFAGAMWIAWLFSRRPVSEWVPLRRIPGQAIAGVVVGSVGAMILLSEVDNLVRFVLPTPEWLVELFLGLSKESFWAAGFVLVIVAPVTEEILFRGVILPGFLRRFGVLKAFLLSAILFGGIHLNPWQFISASGLGILFAWWYARTRSLIPSLIGHALVNGMVWLNPTLPFEIEGFNAGDPTGEAVLHPPWLDGLGLITLAAGLWLFGSATPPIRREPSGDLPAAVSSDVVPPAEPAGGNA